jgi:FkbM family methyltransferase
MPRRVPVWALPGVSRAVRAIVPERMGLAIRKEVLTRRVLSGSHLETDIEILPHFIKPHDVCWDIGANAGSYTLTLSRLCRHVHAFEPVPHNRDILRTVLRRRQVGNVTVHELALSDRERQGRMAVPLEGAFGGYYMAALSDDGTQPVQETTVDALSARGVEPPAVIKCDVEGAEDRVISGALGLIERQPPVWLLETFEDSVFERMLGLGYRSLVYETERRLVPVTRRLATARNYWFVPA